MKLSDKLSVERSKRLARLFSYQELCAISVDWYRRNGKYPNTRIVKDSDGVEYVIGDWSWNRNPKRGPETIEFFLNKVYDEAADKKERLTERGAERKAME